MAIYDLGTASLAANGEVTGVGTTWKSPLTLIRVGATIVFKTEPVQIYTISEIISDTQINVYNPNSETVPAGTGYAILAHDGITVQGLAQDVAETLRYYQSRETEVADAVDAFSNFDANDFSAKVSQVNTQYGEVISIGAQVSNDAAKVANDAAKVANDATQVANDKDSAAASAQEAADYAASLDTQNLLKKDLALSDLTDKQLARQNLDVYKISNTDNLIASFNVVEVKNGDTVSLTSSANFGFVKAIGGNFTEYEIFPIVRKARDGTRIQISGVVSSLNLSSSPYSVTIGGKDYWLLDRRYFTPSKPSLRSFWAVEGNDQYSNNKNMEALLGSFSDVYIDAGVFHFNETIMVPEYTKIEGAGDTNSTHTGWNDRTSQLIYTPTNPSEPFIALAENGSDAYSVSLSDFSISARGNGLNVSTGIARRTKGVWSSDFLSRLSISRLSIYDFESGISLDHAWLVETNRVVVKMPIAGSPTGTGIRIKRGTSLSARSCFCLGGLIGWALFTTYSTLVSCASDQQAGNAYLLGPGLSLYSCGVESTREGGSLFIATSRSYDDPSAPLIFDPVKIYNCNGLITSGSCVAFSDEAGFGGSIEATGCSFEAGDSFIPFRARGSEANKSYFNIKNCVRLATSSQGLKIPINIGTMLSNVGLTTNSGNVLVNFDSSESFSFVSKTVSNGSGGSYVCFKVPAGQSFDITTSQPQLKVNNAYVTQSNSRLRFNTSYSKTVLLSDLKKGSSSIGVSFHSSTSDFASVFVLYTLSGVPAGTELLIKFNQGCGVEVSPSLATSGTTISYISML